LVLKKGLFDFPRGDMIGLSFALCVERKPIPSLQNKPFEDLKINQRVSLPRSLPLAYPESPLVSQSVYHKRTTTA